jgi:Rrf2 family protein
LTPFSNHATIRPNNSDYSILKGVQAMQLTRSADYAVRAMLDIAAQTSEEEGRARTHMVAQRQDIPPALLAKLVPLLVRAGLLDSQRGARGGLYLARPASEISMLEIVEAVEGPIAINRCTATPAQCDKVDQCSVHPVWQKAQDYLVHLLQTTSLAELQANKASS